MEETCSSTGNGASPGKRTLASVRLLICSPHARTTSCRCPGRLCRWPCGFGSPAGSPCAVLAQQVPATPTVIPPADPDGEMPPGAVAVLGAVRCRNGGPVSTLAVSPDGTMVACTGVHHPSVRVWDVNTGQEVHRLPVPKVKHDPKVLEPLVTGCPICWAPGLFAGQHHPGVRRPGWGDHSLGLAPDGAGKTLNASPGPPIMQRGVCPVDHCLEGSHDRLARAVRVPECAESIRNHSG